MHHELTASARPSPAGPVVADAMIRSPKLCGTDLTVGQAHDHLLDDHVHALLVVDGGGLLVSVVEREDLAGASAGAPVWPLGCLVGRVADVGDDLACVTSAMALRGRRRVAVVDDGRVAGLLCRKRSGHGFCSDDDVAARRPARSAI